MTTVPASALAELEAALVDLGPALKKAEPQQYARAQRLAAALRGGAARADELQALSLELLRWQLALQKTRYEGQLGALAALIGRHDPAALAAEKALRTAIALLERSLEVTASPHRARTSAELASFRELARELDRAAAAAATALRRSASTVPLRPVHTQPTAPGGATLRPAPPRPRKADLAPFKLRPGAIPPGATKASHR